MSAIATDVSVSAACAPDLEYDPDFLRLSQLASGRPEQQFGTTLIPAQAPDWNEVADLAAALLIRSPDLRVAVLLTRAWTQLRGLPGFAEGLAQIARLLVDEWEQVHPHLTIDDEFDPMPRMNAIAALTEPAGMGRAVRSALLLEAGRDGLSLREAEAILDGEDDANYPGGAVRLREALTQAWLSDAVTLIAVLDARAALATIRQRVVASLGSEWAPPAAALDRSLATVAACLHAPAAAPDAPSEPSPVAAPAAPAWHGVDIRSRDEAAAMLAKVARYFEQHEPSHPAPFLLRRVQQLVPLDFHDILKNLAPQGLSEFEAWLPRAADNDPVR